MKTYTIKPLEWERGQWYAGSCKSLYEADAGVYLYRIGRYRIIRDGNGIYWEYTFDNRYRDFRIDEPDEALAVEKAKQAAQEHWESRLASALLEQP